MASIITATTTSGLTQSADNSGVLQLASGVGNLVTIPAVTGTAMVSGNMPAFRAYANSTTTIANATFTKVILGVEDFDTNSNFASSRFTPTVAGYYQINAGIEFDLTSSPAIVAIYKNGALVSSSISTFQAATYNATPSVSDLVYLNGSTDYVELYGAQASGSSKVTVANTNTKLSGSLVRAA